MPLVKRLIVPVELGRVDKIDPHIRNELELVSNHSLANVIRQLSSLSRNAEDMFTELSGEAGKVFDRARTLQDRVVKLHNRVTQLDATVEEVSLHDINLRKPYRSSFASDQQVVARNTIPTAVVATYLNSEPPPPLAKLNIYREDGKDSLKFYTDPGYFFDLWYSQIKKDIEERKKELKEKKHKKRPRPAHETHAIRKIKTNKDKYEDMSKGVEFSQYQAPTIDNARPDTLDVNHAPQGMTKIDENHAPTTQAQQQQQSRRSNANSRIMNGPTSRVSHANEYPQMANNSGPSPHEMENHYPSPDVHSNRKSAVKSPAGRATIHRPGQAPPAPPPPNAMTPPKEPHVMTNSADMLPPPPPPPDDSNYRPHDSPASRYSQQQQQYRESSLRQSVSPPPPPHPDGHLPPPPPSPPMTRRLSGEMSMSPELLPPPPSPPPPPPMFNDNSPTVADSRQFSPPPPPPPPLMTAPNTDIPAAPSLPNGGLNSGLANALKGVTLKSPVKEPPVVEEIDERSALLQEIRLGMWNLKTVAETQRREQKRPSDQLDVQTIMDRAFEMRRKAMEDSEEEEEVSDDDDWEEDA